MIQSSEDYVQLQVIIIQSGCKLKVIFLKTEANVAKMEGFENSLNYRNINYTPYKNISAGKSIGKEMHML